MDHTLAGRAIGARTDARRRGILQSASHPTTSESATLCVRNLSVERGGRTVVRDASFGLRRGEIVAVIGPNGAGKTTLLEGVTGLRRRRTGEVSFDGVRLRSFAAFARVFSFMPDDAGATLEASVRTLVSHADECSGAPDALARDLLGRLGLPPLLDARAGELSRGERKRVALYAALCTTRPVVVLDEPFGAFDPLQAREVLAVVRDRASEGTAVLVSIHQMIDAERIADRVLLMADGRAVAFGTLDDLRARWGGARASLEDVFLRALEGRGDAEP